MKNTRETELFPQKKNRPKIPGPRGELLLFSEVPENVEGVCVFFFCPHRDGVFLFMTWNFRTVFFAEKVPLHACFSF